MHPLSSFLNKIKFTLFRSLNHEILSLSPDCVSTQMDTPGRRQRKLSSRKILNEVTEGLDFLEGRAIDPTPMWRPGPSVKKNTQTHSENH